MDIEYSEALKLIKLRDTLLRLEDNSDFKEVILDGFLEDFAKQLVIQRALPEFRVKEDLIESVDRKIDAVGELYLYLRNIKINGSRMEQVVEEMKQQEKEIETEEYMYE